MALFIIIIAAIVALVLIWHRLKKLYKDSFPNDEPLEDEEHEEFELREIKQNVKTFVIISEDEQNNCIMYDPDTNIMYEYRDVYDDGKVIVLRNSDGTPKKYSPIEEDETI